MNVLFYVGAVAVTYMFWQSGFAKLADFPQTLAEMAHFGLNPPWLFAVGTIAHDFWNMPPQAAFGERLIAQEHISVVGGLIVAALVAREYGPQWRIYSHGR